MRVEDVMTREVLGTSPEAGIADAAKSMLDHRISGLPVIDAESRLVGMLTEGDLLRRSEIGTTAGSSGWRAFLSSSGRLAGTYIHTHSRRVGDVMSTHPVTVAADASLADAVDLMLKHRVKRLPVTGPNGALVGIIARSDIMRALVGALPTQAAPTSDAEIAAAISSELRRQKWAGIDNIRIHVHDGIVRIDGTVFDERQRAGIEVVAENVAGVKQVVDDLTWIEPTSGMVISSPEDETAAEADSRAA
jgi:CBS domain-containing protein